MRWPWRPSPAAPDEPLIEAPPLPALDVIQRGDSATRLLQDPVLAGAFKEIRDDAYKLWLGTGASEGERREELYRIVQALELVRGKLRAYRGAAMMREAERKEQERAA